MHRFLSLMRTTASFFTPWTEALMVNCNYQRTAASNTETGDCCRSRTVTTCLTDRIEQNLSIAWSSATRTQGSVPRHRLWGVLSKRCRNQASYKKKKNCFGGASPCHMWPSLKTALDEQVCLGSLWNPKQMTGSDVELVHLDSRSYGLFFFFTPPVQLSTSRGAGEGRAGEGLGRKGQISFYFPPWCLKSKIFCRVLNICFQTASSH